MIARAVAVAAVALVAVLLPSASPAALRLDAGFGDGGVARVPFQTDSVGYLERPLRPVRQPDGKVLVAAAIESDRGPAQVALVRFRRNGRPDATFGQGGRVRLGAHWNFSPRAVAVQPDGRIILMGQAGTGVTGWYPLVAPAQVGLIRLLPDGSLDRSFGQDGAVIWSPPRRPDTRIMEALVGLLQRQPDGRLLIPMFLDEGRSPANGGIPLVEVGRAAFLRFNRNGSVDESFGRAGLVERPKAPEFVDVWAALPGGKFVALSSDGLLRRFTADGAIDRGFGRHRPVGLWENQHAGLVWRDGLTAARDGSLIAIANDENNVGLPLRRFLPGGRLDAAFGTACARPPLPFGLAGTAATPDGGALATAWTLPTAFIPLDRGSPPDTTLFVRYGARGCVAERPLHVRATSVPGPPLLQRHRTAIAGAVYYYKERSDPPRTRGLALIRIRR